MKKICILRTLENSEVLNNWASSQLDFIYQLQYGYLHVDILENGTFRILIANNVNKGYTLIDNVDEFFDIVNRTTDYIKKDTNLYIVNFTELKVEYINIMDLFKSKCVFSIHDSKEDANKRLLEEATRLSIDGKLKIQPTYLS